MLPVRRPVLPRTGPRPRRAAADRSRGRAAALVPRRHPRAVARSAGRPAARSPSSSASTSSAWRSSCSRSGRGRGPIPTPVWRRSAACRSTAGSCTPPSAATSARRGAGSTCASPATGPGATALVAALVYLNFFTSHVTWDAAVAAGAGAAVRRPADVGALHRRPAPLRDAARAVLRPHRLLPLGRRERRDVPAGLAVPVAGVGVDARPRRPSSGRGRCSSWSASSWSPRSRPTRAGSTGAPAT